MGTIASELRAEREKREIPLAHIAAETRISLRHLESLEEGRYSDMPGGIYNRAFLKAYCEILDLNVSDVLRRFDAELALASDKSSRNRVHKSPQNRSFNFGRFFAWVSVLVIAGVGAYFGKQWITTAFSPHFSHTAVSAGRHEPENPPQNPETAKNTIAPSPHPEALAPSSQATTPAAKELPASPAPPEPLRAAEAAGQPLSALQPALTQTIRLEVIATERSWVSIERDGVPAFRKNMDPGDIRSFDAAEKFLIIVGNAGGVNLKLNGKPVKPLGGPGSVVRVLIDRTNLQDFLDQTAG
jgi:cytoskeleton protein RodZ